MKVNISESMKSVWELRKVSGNWYVIITAVVLKVTPRLKPYSSIFSFALGFLTPKRTSQLSQALGRSEEHHRTEDIA